MRTQDSDLSAAPVFRNDAWPHLREDANEVENPWVRPC